MEYNFGEDMRLKPGDKAKEIELPAIDGSMFNMNLIEDKPFMLTFYRFASCPFCNLRVNEMIKRFDEFGDDFTMIAIFDSSIDTLIRHSDNQQAPFHILADGTRTSYQKYGVERSLFGMLKGMILRFPTLMMAMLRGYIPREFKGSLLTMPADFLVNREGIIQEAYYGSDEGDHLPFDRIKKFSLE